MNAAVLVFVGAGIGGVLRHFVNIYAPRVFGTGFPAGTMCINVLGSFLIGCAAGWLAFRMSEPWSQSARLFAVTGILGGFTTFSAFSLDFVALLERGSGFAGAGYLVLSVVISLAAVFGGLALGRAML